MFYALLAYFSLFLFFYAVLLFAKYCDSQNTGKVIEEIARSGKADGWKSRGKKYLKEVKFYPGVLAEMNSGTLLHPFFSKDRKHCTI